MSEKPLLLSSAKVPTVVHTSPRERYLRTAALVVGAFVVIVGAADVSARIARYAFGEEGGVIAFAPAVALLEPGVLATSTATAPFVPTHLAVPSVGIKATVSEVGLTAQGTMGVPKSFNEVGWYAHGPKPGEKGRAVFAGHIDNALTQAGVFEHLPQVKVGDYITISNDAGKTLLYKVSELHEYPNDDTSAREVFLSSGPSQVALITCVGEWNAKKKEFEKRLVVLANVAH